MQGIQKTRWRLITVGTHKTFGSVSLIRVTEFCHYLLPEPLHDQKRCAKVLTKEITITEVNITQIPKTELHLPRLQNSWGQHGVCLGPVGPRRAPWTLLSGYYTAGSSWMGCSMRFHKEWLQWGIPGMCGSAYVILVVADALVSHRHQTISHQHPGGRLNKKDGLTRYGNSHVKDKTS